MSDDTCAACGCPIERYGCTVLDEGIYCHGPPRRRPARVHPIPPSSPVVRCSLCRARVVWIIDPNFRRLTVDAIAGTEHQPHCPKKR